MKKQDVLLICWLAILSACVLFISSAFAGGVQSDNNGNAGYIFVATGENHGADSRGVWTDPTSISGLKGDKGDTGATGSQGIQGVKGDTGTQGIAGQDGVNGTNGIDGAKGDKGDKGDQGLKGIQGDIGLTGTNGKDVDPTTVTNLQNTDAQLSNRIDSLSSRLDKLEQTQFVFEPNFRIFDSKRVTVLPFFRYNFTRSKVDTVGLRIVIKLGKSYEEKLIEKQNKRIDILEKKMGHTPVIERVVDENGHTKSISIRENGLAVSGTF